jgi:hypothetical protein
MANVRSARDGCDGAQICSGAGGEPAFETQGVAKTRDDLAFVRHQDQVLDAHQLGNRGHHLGREPGREGGEGRGVHRVGQEPVAEIPDRQVRDARERLCIVVVDDEAGYLVAFVGDDRFVEEGLERYIGQRALRGRAFLGAVRRNAGERIAGPRRAGLGQQGLEVVEAVVGVADAV